MTFCDWDAIADFFSAKMGFLLASEPVRQLMMMYIEKSDRECHCRIAIGAPAANFGVDLSSAGRQSGIRRTLAHGHSERLSR